MMKTYISIALLAIILIAGCAQPVDDNKKETGAKYSERLLEKANTLATNELIRFNAIEMLYRNIPEKHSMILPGTNQKNGGWVKTYRRFTSYSIIDVTQTNSLINPITFDISYSFDVFGSQFRQDSIENAQEVSQKDSAYKKRYSGTLEKRYLCDENGDTLLNQLSLPERPRYFKDDILNEQSEIPNRF
jgi:hypothetical protein